jgi:two-component system, OmpR family, response regulator
VSTILVVDDESSIQDFLEMALSDEGYQVISAYKGHEALTVLSHSRPDLILLDMWMPGMDGKTFLGHHHKIQNALVPVIIMTACTDFMDDTVLLASVSDFMSKPFDLENMLACIEKQLLSPK